MNVQEAVRGPSERPELHAVEVVWDYVDEFRRVEKDRRLIFSDVLYEFFIQFFPLPPVRRGTRLRKQAVDLRVRVESDVEPGVVPLRRVPKCEQVERTTDDFSEKQSLIIPWSKKNGVQLRYRIHVHIHLDARLTPGRRDRLRGCGKLRLVDSCKREFESGGFLFPNLVFFIELPSVARKYGPRTLAVNHLGGARMS